MNSNAAGNTFISSLFSSIQLPHWELSALKIGILLWASAALAGLVTLQLHQHHVLSILDGKMSSDFRSELFPQYRPKPSANWSPRAGSQTPVGALSDSNASRLNDDGADLQNILNDRPLGSDVPYRTQP